MMQRLSVGIICLSISVGCNFVTKRKNDPHDIGQAKSKATLFYENLRNQNFDDAVDLYASIPIKERTRDSVLMELKSKQANYGRLNSFKYVDGTSYVVEGSKQYYEYEVEYDVKYEHQQTVERLLMIQEKGTIKILGYKLRLVEKTDSTTTSGDSIQ